MASNPDAGRGLRPAAYELTEEGARYAREQLPELRLLKALPLSLAEAKKLPDFAIAMQWAKANGWVALEAGVLTPTTARTDSPLQKALEALAAGSEPAADQLTVLLKRGLARESRGPSLHEVAIKQIEAGTAELTPELLQTGLWTRANLKPYNVAAPGRAPLMGKRHPYQAFLARVRERLLGLGFRELTGPTVETQFWNFDALYQPQGHPARDWTDVYSLREPLAGELPDPKLVARVRQAHEKGLAGSRGWQRPWSPEKAALLLPRAHDTAITPRGLAGLCGPLQTPGKYFQLVRCYRPDVIDATHAVEFNQLGGFVLDEAMNFRHMLGLLKTFVHEVTGIRGARIRFTPDYFPFVEPGVEISVKHPTRGWLELAGAGLAREEMTKALGIDAPTLMWGFGVDRLAMLALGITDIRQLFSPDLSWLRRFPVYKELSHA